MDHIEVMKRAIEFRGPAHLPLEVLDVPGLYHDFWRQKTGEVQAIPGSENFDSLMVEFDFVPRDEGKDKKGNTLLRDEWGCLRMYPKDGEYSYFVVEQPLKRLRNLKSYVFPDPSVSDDFFSRLEGNLVRYRDRFIVGYIDPGPFELAMDLVGIEDLLIAVIENPNDVVYLLEGIMNYHKGIIKRWKDAGAHMIYYFEEYGHKDGLFFSPSIFRKYFKPLYKDIFRYIHEHDMYVGCGLDGKVLPLLPEFKEAGMDVFHTNQPRNQGIDELAKVCDGKLCVKSSLDLQRTLPSNCIEDLYDEAKELVSKLGTRNGGLIALVQKYLVLNFPEENVEASVKAFNHFRKNVH